MNGSRRRTSSSSLTVEILQGFRYLRAAPSMHPARRSRHQSTLKATSFLLRRPVQPADGSIMDVEASRAIRQAEGRCGEDHDRAHAGMLRRARTSRSTRSATSTRARQATSSRRRARWSMMTRRFSIWRAHMTARFARSRRDAPRRCLLAGSRAASMQTPAMSPAHSQRPRRSSDRAATGNVPRCCSRA
jgi:hypothetical protein